jgi:hypothetical protein
MGTRGKLRSETARRHGTVNPATGRSPHDRRIGARFLNMVEADTQSGAVSPARSRPVPAWSDGGPLPGGTSTHAPRTLTHCTVFFTVQSNPFNFFWRGLKKALTMRCVPRHRRGAEVRLVARSPRRRNSLAHRRRPLHWQAVGARELPRARAPRGGGWPARRPGRTGEPAVEVITRSGGALNF